MASEVLSYDRCEGFSNHHAILFETDLRDLTYLRCLKEYKNKRLKSFKIASNVKYVGNFDDVVCHIEFEGNVKPKLIFIRARHVENHRGLVYSDETLINPRKARFTLGIYLPEFIESYFVIRKIFDESELMDQRKNLRKAFNCKLEDAQFVYYTNATEGELSYFEKMCETDIITNIFDTSPNGAVYKIKSEYIENSDFLSKIHTKTDLSHNDIDGVKQFLKNFRVYLNQGCEQWLHEIKSCLDYPVYDYDSLLSKLKFEINQMQQSVKFCKNGNFCEFLTEENYIDKIYSLLQLQLQTDALYKNHKECSKIYSDDSVQNDYNELMNHKCCNIYYEKLEKSKALVKFVRLVNKFKGGFMGFLYISKDSFKIWEEVRNLHNYTKGKVLVCIENEPITDVNQICSPNKGTQEFIVTISENKLVLEKELWEQLSYKKLDKILDYKVAFQNFPMTLSDLFGDRDLKEIFKRTGYKKAVDTLVSLVFTRKVIIIGSPLPEENDNKEREYKKIAAVLSYETKPEMVEIMNDEGCVQYIKNNKCTIISDHAGTGETMTLRHLSHCFKNTYKEYWVANINLHSIDIKLCLKNMKQHLKKERERVYTPVEALTSLMNLDDDVAKMIFEHKCCRDGKVALFFDGYNDTSTENKEIFIRLFEALSETEIQTMVLFATSAVAEDLKNKLQISHFNIVGVNITEQSELDPLKIVEPEMEMTDFLSLMDIDVD